MGREPHILRNLEEGEPSTPTRAWVERADGAAVDLALRQVGPAAWEATADPPVIVTAQDHLRLDRLCSGCRVVFTGVRAAGETPQ